MGKTQFISSTKCLNLSSYSKLLYFGILWYIDYINRYLCKLCDFDYIYYLLFMYLHHVSYRNENLSEERFFFLTSNENKLYVCSNFWTLKKFAHRKWTW